jgi:hypothetical protein
VSVLLSFFVNVFGVTIGTAQNDCQISGEPMFAARRADALFIYDLISFEDYCVMMPTNMPPSENACGKIMQAINYRFPTMTDCINYCNQYINAIRQQKLTGVFSPVFRVKKQ